MKHELTIGRLEATFKKAIDIGVKYVAVAIQFDDVDDVEIIINPIRNAEYKLEYYKQTYNDDLTHRYAKGVKILGVSCGHSFEDIEYDLIVRQCK